MASSSLKGLSLLAVLFGILGTLPAVAGELIISDGYVRATPPGVNSSAAYLTLRNNTDHQWVLVTITSNRAQQVMMHQNQLQGDMMRMRHLPQLKIAAGKQFSFQPTGHHLMLTGIEQPLSVGEEIAFSFEFERGQVLEVSFPVVGVAPGMDMKMNGQHDQHN